MQITLPITIPVGHVTIIVMATSEGIYVRCIDPLVPTQVSARNLPDLDAALEKGAVLAKELLKAYVERLVDGTLAQYRGL